MTDREQHLVELVDDAGTPVGRATVAAAHRAPGRLHRAFSVFLVDPAGRLLLQRRAATKTRFAGRWANSCCGHPAPGATLAGEAAARVRDELGIAVDGLRELGVYRYRADDAATGLVECEYDHVLLGRVPADTAAAPDPGEVSEIRWIDRAALHDSLASEPDAYAPWLPGVLALVPPAPPG
jgi:isopentenyl-diphosphate delta-isomerase